MPQHCSLTVSWTRKRKHRVPIAKPDCRRLVQLSPRAKAQLSSQHTCIWSQAHCILEYTVYKCNTSARSHDVVTLRFFLVSVSFLPVHLVVSFSHHSCQQACVSFLVIFRKLKRIDLMHLISMGRNAGTGRQGKCGKMLEGFTKIGKRVSFCGVQVDTAV